MERDDALRFLDELVAAARGGSGGALFVRGEAGMGKTALVDTARASAGDSATVVEAHGSPMETDVPFAYAEQFAGRLLPEEPGAIVTHDPHERRAQVHQVARARIRTLSARSPVLILLDDLQWSDPESLGIVNFLCRRAGRLPVAFIGTFRAWPRTALAVAESLVRDRCATVQTIGALSAAATTALLARRAGRPLDDEVLRRGSELVAGNPLLAVEAARILSAEGDLPDPRDANVRQLQQALLLSQFAGLPPVARACAQAASIFGSRARVADVEAMTGLPDTEFASALDTLVRAGIVRDAGNGWTQFGHDLVASALVDDLGPGERASLHRRAFRLFADRGDVASAAPHAVAAELAGDERAISALASAGELALREGAARTAIAQLGAAVELAGPEPPDDLLVRQADALFAAGRPEDAVMVYERLLGRQLPDHVRLDTLIKAARAQAYAGRLDEALVTFDDLLAGPRDLGLERVAVVLERAHVVWELRGPVAGLDALSPGDGEPPAAPIAELLAAVRGSFLLHTGDASGLGVIEKLAIATRRRITSGTSGDPVASANAFLLHVSACGATERFEKAADFIDVADEWLQRAGALWPRIPLRIALLGQCVHRGEPQRAISEADDLEEEFEVDALLQPYVSLYRALALTWLGRGAEAGALTDAVRRLPGARPWFVALGIEMARGHQLLADGRHEESVRAYEAAEELAQQAHLGEPCILPWAAGAVEAAITTGELDAVARITDWLHRASTTLPCRWPQMVALAGEAALAGATDEADRATDLYERALALPPVAHLDRARILLRFGAWLRRRNVTMRARAVLREALEIAEPRGAAVLASRAAAELAAAGGRRRRPRSTAGLTPQEARAAALAATGATTKEAAEVMMLSPRTVESHLSSAYRKLGVTSKQELRQRRDELALGADSETSLVRP